MAPRWYVARTKPRRDLLAVKELRWECLEVFLPRTKASRPLTGASGTSVFPGHLRCAVT